MPTGRYVSSIEVFEPEAQRAWRARQGVNQEPIIRGLVALSDLMVLREGAPLPADLDEAVPLARPNVRIRADERFTVVWEVYGLGVDQAVQVTLGFTQGRPGFLARVGDFLGIVEPDQPVEVSFSDAGSSEVETLFRAVALQLPALEPGSTHFTFVWICPAENPRSTVGQSSSHPSSRSWRPRSCGSPHPGPCLGSAV